MPTTCFFEFSRLEPVFYSGEVINGLITLTTTKSKSIREVYIHFKGEANVHWEEDETRALNGKTHHYTERFHAAQQYISSRTNVQRACELPPGTHTYRCSIPLPKHCPTSCTNKYGKISYELSLVIDRSLRFRDVFSRPLTVLQRLDLNLDPEYSLPLTQDHVKNFTTWLCCSGRIITTLTIPFSAYAPGQDINYSLEIDNQSSRHDVEGIELVLTQIYRFVAQTPHYETREVTNTLAKASQNKRVLRLSKSEQRGSLKVPPTSPSTQRGGIITVRYCIEMSIKFSGCENVEEIEMPITIGTIPLTQSVRIPLQMVNWKPATPSMLPQEDDLRLSQERHKLTSFEGATSIVDKFIDIDRDEPNRNDDFIPKYPMYTNFAMPTAPPDTPDTPLIDKQQQQQQQLHIFPATRVERNIGWALPLSPTASTEVRARIENSTTESSTATAPPETPSTPPLE